MIGIVLHKLPDSSIKTSKFSDQFFSHVTKITKHENSYQNSNGICISNAYIPETLNASQKIWELYQKYNNKTVDFLRSEFSFGLVDESNTTFFGARDRMGIKPFYYYNSEELFIYSTDIKFIIEKINNNYLSDEWILGSLSGTVFDKTTSPIRSIKKLPPAHYLILKDGQITIKKYWDLKKQNIPLRSDKENIELLKMKFKQAIKARLLGNIGGELSGGIDSSGIIGHIANEGQKVQAYSHMLTLKYHNKISPYGDERFYRDLLADMYTNINPQNIETPNKGLFSEIQNEIRLHAVPVNNALTYLSDGIYEKAQEDGIDVLFSGFGGDEGISNYGNVLFYEYAKNLKFSSLKKAIGKSYLSKDFIKYLVTPYWQSMDKSRKKWRQRSYNLFFINEEYAEAMNFDSLYWGHKKNQNIKTLDAHVYQKLSENYISNRTELTGASARTRGIEYTFPLLDIDLIEYYYNLPNSLKYKNGINRYLYREIIKNFVPEKIYRRKGKTGATIPNSLLRFMNDYKKIEEFLQSARNGAASSYINFDKMIENMKLIKQMAEGKKGRSNPHIFLNALMLTIYLENEY